MELSDGGTFFFSPPDICAVFVSPIPEITVLIMSGMRVAGAVCQDDGQIVDERGLCMVLAPL